MASYSFHTCQLFTLLKKLRSIERINLTYGHQDATISPPCFRMKPPKALGCEGFASLVSFFTIWGF